MKPSIGHRSLKRQALLGLVPLLVLVVSPLVKGLADDRTGENTGKESFSAVSEEQAGKRLLIARCAVCHSTDLIIQQRLTRTQWIATLNKMANWGAQVSAAEQIQLVDYLAARYYPGAAAVSEQATQETLKATITEPTTHVGVPPLPAGRPEQGQQLFGQNCVPCHGPAAAGDMGPKLAKNPILTDERRFWDTVRQGRGAMPAWGAMLTAQEIADIQVWLKTLE